MKKAALLLMALSLSACFDFGVPGEPEFEAEEPAIETSKPVPEKHKAEIEVSAPSVMAAPGDPIEIEVIVHNRGTEAFVLDEIRNELSIFSRIGDLNGKDDGEEVAEVYGDVWYSTADFPTDAIPPGESATIHDVFKHTRAEGVYTFGARIETENLFAERSHKRIGGRWVPVFNGSAKGGNARVVVIR